MIDVRPFASLGSFRNDWLDARYHFSFANYHNPQRMGFGRLLVWNDDVIGAKSGFDPHPHRDMEIITYAREGAITHRDSMGNEGRIEAGDIQVMHAGTGVVHSEYNQDDIPALGFQIWVLPDQKRVQPGWGMRRFPHDQAAGLLVLASGRDRHKDSDALPLYADAALMAGTVAKGDTIHVPLGAGRAVYMVPARGAITVNGVAAGPRDGVAILGEDDLEITATETAEIVLMDISAT